MSPEIPAIKSKIERKGYVNYRNLDLMYKKRFSKSAKVIHSKQKIKGLPKLRNMTFSSIRNWNVCES